MDNNALNDKLAQLLDRTPEDVSNLLAGFVSLMKTKCADLQDVAIPGFGTFVVDKQMEHIEVDAETNKRTLMPPKVELSFEPSVVLKSVIVDKEK